MGRHHPAPSGGLIEVSAATSPDVSQHGSPALQPESLIQAAAWALASMGVREPGAALLEPLAIALFSLDAAFRSGWSEADTAGASPQTSERSG
jgi:hypothetical protein